MNKVILIGNVGQDPESAISKSGMPICNFSVATKESGQKAQVQWHKIVAFGKTAELVQQYVKKGKKVAIEGTIDYQMNEKNGVKTYYTKIICNQIEFLSYEDIDKVHNNQTRPDKKTKPEIVDSDDIPF